jgi:hypothetical protein
MTVYTTRFKWAEGSDAHHVVCLLRDGVEVASMTLDEWMDLGAVEFAVSDAVRQTLHSAEEAARHRGELSADEAAALRTAARGRRG